MRHRDRVGGRRRNGGFAGADIAFKQARHRALSAGWRIKIGEDLRDGAPLRPRRFKREAFDEFINVMLVGGDAKRFLLLVSHPLLRLTKLDQEDFLECESLACRLRIALFFRRMDPNERGAQSGQVVPFKDIQRDRIFDCLEHPGFQHPIKCMIKPQRGNTAAFGVNGEQAFSFQVSAFSLEETTIGSRGAFHFRIGEIGSGSSAGYFAGDFH